MSSRHSHEHGAVSRHGKWFLLALCLAAAAVFALLWPSIQDWRDRGDDGQTSAVELTITPLSAKAAKECGKVDTAALQRATTAVTGTYQGLDGNKAIFVADHWYKGGPAEQVQISSSSTASLTSALKAAGLDQGRVLIASRSGEVLMCGESGPYDSTLGALYVTTFAAN